MFCYQGLLERHVNQAAQRGAGSGEGDERRSEKVRAKEAIVA